MAQTPGGDAMYLNQLYGARVEHSSGSFRNTLTAVAGDDLYAPLEEEEDEVVQTHRRGLNEVVADAFAVTVADTELVENGRRKRPFLLRPYLLLRSIPVQLLMVVLLIVDAIFLLYEIFSGSYRFDVVTLLTCTIFFVELGIVGAFEGMQRYVMPGGTWLMAEATVVASSAILEYITFIIIHSKLSENKALLDALVQLRAIRLVRLVLLMKTRYHQLTAALRQLVSADRRRYQFEGFDLDLTYITSRVIAMSWPATSAEGLYRNPIDTVAHFLDTKHNSAYRVYNLCSERRYDESKFHYTVVSISIDDHNPPELAMMLTFSRSVDEFLQSEARRVAVVHCKGGKGRTGTMVCAYLMYSGFCGSAAAALEYFGKRRTSDSAKSFQGVESPSQSRYVHYFERVLRLPGHAIPTRRVRVTRLLLDGVPLAWCRYLLVPGAAESHASASSRERKSGALHTDVEASRLGGSSGLLQPALGTGLDSLWFAVVTTPCSTRSVAYLSNPTVTFDPFGSAQYARPNASESFQQPLSLPVATAKYGNPVGRAANVTILDDADDYGVGKSAGRTYRPERDTFVVYVNREWTKRLSMDEFEAMCAAPAVAKSVTHVSIELANPAAIPELDGDAVFKFFYAQNNPNALKSPLQFWFHTAFEGSSLHLSKGGVDGPHKSGSIIAKQLASDFGVTLQLADL